MLRVTGRASRLPSRVDDGSPASSISGAGGVKPVFARTGVLFSRGVDRGMAGDEEAPPEVGPEAEGSAWGLLVDVVNVVDLAVEVVAAHPRRKPNRDVEELLILLILPIELVEPIAEPEIALAIAGKYRL